MGQIITYGLGGYDSNKPDNNIILITESHEDDSVIEAANARTVLLKRLGITEDEARLLFS